MAKSMESFDDDTSTTSSRKRRRNEEIEESVLEGLVQCGRFWHPPDIKPSGIAQLADINATYTEDQLRNIMLPLIEGDENRGVSLRALDWAVTNYSESLGVIIHHPIKAFNIAKEYAAQLKRYKRHTFGTFRRGARVYFSLDQKLHETTIAQLTFMQWVHRTGVLQFTKNNLRSIMDHHAQAMASNEARKAEEKALGIKPTRQPLSKKVRQAIMVSDMGSGGINITFDPEDEA